MLRGVASSIWFLQNLQVTVGTKRNQKLSYLLLK